MRTSIHRSSFSHFSRLVFPITVALWVLTLSACGNKSESADVAPVVTVAITPKAPTLVVNATQTFTVVVTGNSNGSVTWSTDGGGIDSSTGKYTAAAKAGTYHVKATSVASSTASDTATVTVTAPAPAITSSALTLALQDTPYSYALTATDPSGANDVTFALTTSPAGATISGGTISWTPIQSQSRVDNAFTVTATTPAGGTATQSWTVNPSGTIQGSDFDTYWGANSTTTTPNDLSAYTFSALVVNADGTTTTFPGAGSSDGTFTIPGVPAGNYWLIYDDQQGDGTLSFWTNSSKFDIGQDFTGRNMSSVTCDGTASLTLALSGLDFLADYSDLTISIPNQQNYDVADFTVNPGYTAYGGSTNLVCPVDPDSGDVAYVIQEEPMTGLATDFSEYNTIPGPSLASVSPTSLTGALATASPQSVDFQIQGAAWAAAFNNVDPGGSGTVEYGEFEVGVQPFVSDRYAFGSTYLAGIYTDQNLSSTVDAGTVAFNNPYPSTWLQVFSGDVDGPSTENAYATTTAQPGGFAPLMSGVQNPMMNGGSLFTVATTTASSVTLSWTAPTGLTPAGYEISFNCADASCPGNSTGQLYTASNSITLPPGVLAAGYDYVFDIGAVADSRANFNSSPNRSGYPTAYADVISAPLFFNPTSPLVTRNQAAASKVANKNVIHNRYGTFLVTAKGNKPLDIKARMLAHVYQRRTAQAAKAASAVK